MGSQNQVTYNRYSNKALEQAKEADGKQKNLIFWFLPKPENEVKEAVNNIFNYYYENIANKKNTKDKILFIASIHRKLENLHPFIDGNSRVNRLVLHKFLVENGLTPVIIGNPLIVHLKSDQEWAEILKEGMKAWEEVLQSQKL